MEQSIWVSGTRYVGFKVTHWVSEVGRVTLMYGDMIRSALGKLPSYRVTIEQMGAIGVGSLGLVIVVSLFTGAVAAVQAAYQFSNVVPLKYLGAVILRSTIIELGPVLTALVVGGRVGAAIAAELGTMKVTEQIDAMRAMGINPVRYLVAPRVIAAILMLPVLTIYSDAIAIFGGWVVAVSSVGVPSPTYVQGLREFFYMKDLFSGLLKALFFGGIISTMGCYNGFQTEGGAEGAERHADRDGAGVVADDHVEVDDHHHRLGRGSPDQLRLGLEAGDLRLHGHQGGEGAAQLGHASVEQAAQQLGLDVGEAPCGLVAAGATKQAVDGCHGEGHVEADHTRARQGHEGQDGHARGLAAAVHELRVGHLLGHHAL